MCDHSYHVNCLVDEKECPSCVNRSQKTLEMIRFQEQNATKHDLFFKQLEGSTDGYAVIADYFGKG
eukprot:Pgem_evm2s8587